MKRSDVEPGEEYVTSYGAHIRVVDLDTGWLLKNNKWVRDERMGVRLKPGRDGEPYQTYPINPNIRCIVIGDNGDESIGVVRPQLIVRTWVEHLRVQRQRTRTERASERAGRRVVRALKVKGAVLDTENGTVTVPLTEAARMAGMEVAQ